MRGDKTNILHKRSSIGQKCDNNDQELLSLLFLRLITTPPQYMIKLRH